MRPGEERVMTVDGIVHDGNHLGSPYAVYAACGRLVSLRGLGDPEDRKRGMEAGTVARSAITCVHCMVGENYWGKDRFKPAKGAR